MITRKINSRQATFYSGVIGLTPEQYGKRIHALKATDKKGYYEIMEPVNFKRGESVTFEETTASKKLLKEIKGSRGSRKK